jgi:hypothetical protein
MVTGTATVTFTRDGGSTLIPSNEPLRGLRYTYGLTATSAPTTLYAWSGEDLLRSLDAGCSWSVAATAASDPEMFPPRLVAAKDGTIYAWSDNRQLSYRYDGRGLVKLKQPAAFVGFGVNPGIPNHLRAGSTDGTIWESFDSGDTWSVYGAPLATPTATIFYRFEFDPADLDHIVAGTMAHGTYMTYTGGRTWRKSAGLGTEGKVNAFNVEISPANGDVVWAMALDMAESDSGAPSHGRHIYRSVDGGQNFVKVVDENPEIKLINGPVMAAHPTDPNVLYFVFGTHVFDYGTDLFRYDASTNRVTVTHNRHHGINAIAFSPVDPDVTYLGLERVEGVH